MEEIVQDSKGAALAALFDRDVRSRRQIVAAGGGALLTAGAGGLLGILPAHAQLLSGAGEQANWRFCDKCFAMFYNGPNANVSRCPGGGAHQAQGFLFTLHYDSNRRQPVAGRDSQFDWRFCSKCFCMYWDGNATNKGRCPAGGGHAAYGFMFGLPHDNAANPGQANWRFCGKCYVLFFDDPKNANKGKCGAGGPHLRASNSFNFQLPFQAGAAPPPTASGSSLGQKIVAWAAAHVGQCITNTSGGVQPGTCAEPASGVGPGECTHLVHSALVASGGRPPNYSVTPISAGGLTGYPYTWGTKITSGYQPGDIVELTLASFVGPNNATWYTNSQHTAIIETVKAGSDLGVLQQHAPTRTVNRGDINLGWRLVRGVYNVYRAIPA